MEFKSVDCRGMACPQPVISTREALQGASAPIVVIVDNEAARTNVRRFAESQGASVAVAEEGGEFQLTIEPGEGGAGGQAPQVVCGGEGSGRTVVVVSSEGMGRGDEELGGILMGAFLDTLSQFKEDISHVVFLNAGAKLTVEGARVLEQLRQLEEIGVEVLVCGTCLNHFGISDKLGVGRVSNMYEIVETLNRAARIVRP